MKVVDLRSRREGRPPLSLPSVLDEPEVPSWILWEVRKREVTKDVEDVVEDVVDQGSSVGRSRFLFPRHQSSFTGLLLIVSTGQVRT